MTQDDLHLMLGAYLLGGLSDDDHHVFTEHLRHCAQCQEELGQVSGLPRLLSLVEAPTAPPDQVYAAELAPSEGDLRGSAGFAGLAGAAVSTGPAAQPGSGQQAPETALDALLAAGRKRRQTRRRWLVAGSGVAAAGLLASGVWLGPRLTAEDPRPAKHVTASAVVAGSTASVDIDLVSRGWGTEINLACHNMPAGETLQLFAVNAEGRATPVASWLGTPSGYSDVIGATSLRTAEISALEVRTSSGAVLAAART